MRKRSGMAVFSIGSAWLLLGGGLGLAGCGAPATADDDPAQQLTQDIQTGPDYCRIISCVDQVVDCKLQPSCHECSGDVFAIECCNPYNRSCTVINKPKVVVPGSPLGRVSGARLE